MDGVEGGGSGGGSSTGDPLATVSGEGGGGGASGGAMPAVSTVYVTIPQTATVVSAGNKGVSTGPSFIQMCFDFQAWSICFEFCLNSDICFPLIYE